MCGRAPVDKGLPVAVQVADTGRIRFEFCCSGCQKWRLTQVNKLHRNALTPILREGIKKINTALDYVLGFKVILLKEAAASSALIFQYMP